MNEKNDFSSVCSPGTPWWRTATWRVRLSAGQSSRLSAPHISMNIRYVVYGPAIPNHARFVLQPPNESSKIVLYSAHPINISCACNHQILKLSMPSHVRLLVEDACLAENWLASTFQVYHRLLQEDVVDRGIVKVTPCHSHHVLLQVEDDVVDCNTIQDEKCEAETIGYTTQNKCTKWPRYIEEDC